MELIRDFKKLSKNDVGLAGGKGASLGEMTQAGIPVPPGFVILSASFDKFLEETGLNAEIEATLDSVNHKEMHTVENASEKIEALILGAEMPKDIKDEIGKFFKKLETEYVAVRSSATAEDSASAAWAGQLESYLNTTEKSLLENVKKCWASLFTPRAIFYRFEKDLHKHKISVAVVVQKMVESEKSGIAFSVHPVTQDRNQLIIEAGFGLGEAIVSGQITPDSYVVEKQPRQIIDKQVQIQTRGMYRFAKGGNEWRDIPKELGEKQVLSDKEILEFSEIILNIENHYGFPVDIEWAYEKGKFYVVQSRPITTLQNLVNEQVPKYLNDGDKWILAEEIPDIDFQFSQIWLSSFVNDLEKTIGINYKKVISIYDGYNLKFYYGDKDSEVVSSTILKKIVEDGFGKDINKNIRRVADKLFGTIKLITPSYLKKLSNNQLADFYKKLDDIHTEFYTWSWLPNAVDMFHAHFTNYLKSVLKKYLKTEEKINAALVALSFSEEKSFVQEELESLIHIAIFKKEQPKNTKDFEKMIKDHHDNFFFLKHLWIGKDGVSTIEEYKSAVEKILSEGDPKQALKKEEQTWVDSKKARDNYEKEIKLTKQEKELFREYAEFAFTKAYRRRVQLYWAYKMDFIFEELSKSFGISFMEARFLMPDEVCLGLRDGFSDEMKKIAKIRTKHCVYYAEKNLDVVAIGNDCEVFEKTIQIEEKIDLKEFKGQVACVGRVQGIVKIVNSTSDMDKVNDGDILVSIATNPDIVPAMKKAIAFVTEQGGITSHAAIVAREMKKPCIIGTKIATKVLKDGDMVEVDANNGVVKILSRANISDERGNLISLVKIITREAPLLAIESWYEGIVKETERFFDMKFPESIFVSRQGTIERWSDGNRLDEAPLELAKWVKRNKSKLIEAYRRQKATIASVIAIKKKSNTKEKEILESLNSIRSAFVRGFPGIVVTYLMPLWQGIFAEKGEKLFDDKTIKQCVEWRKETELFFDQSIETFFYLLKQLATVKGWDLGLIKYIRYEELLSALKAGSIKDGELSSRKKSVFGYIDEKLIFEENFDVELAKRGLHIPKETVSGSKELKGSSAHKGVVTGKVKVVFSREELDKVKEGDILVAPMTTPWYLPAMQKSAAFVTDEGGITCHAAIAAREMKKPCIIGTKIATKVLKDGDIIEVDANRGIVKILERK